MSLTIYHNPRCSKSRAALQLIKEKGGEDITVMEYLKTPPTAEELENLLNMLGLQPRDLLRKSEPLYKELGLDDPTLDRTALIMAMVEHPILIERPIVIRSGRAVIGRPPEKILELFISSP